MNLTQRLKYSLKKAEAAESNVDFEIGVNAPAAKYCCRLRKISYRAYGLFVAWSLEAFLSIIWLPHSKLWAIIPWTATFTQC